MNIPKPYEYKKEPAVCPLCSVIPKEVVEAIDDSHYNHPPYGEKAARAWLKRWYNVTTTRYQVERHWMMVDEGIHESTKTTPGPNGEVKKNNRVPLKAVGKRETQD